MTILWLSDAVNWGQRGTRYWDCLTRAFVIVLVRRVERLGLDDIQ